MLLKADMQLLVPWPYRITSRLHQYGGDDEYQYGALLRQR